MVLEKQFSSASPQKELLEASEEEDIIREDSHLNLRGSIPSNTIQKQVSSEIAEILNQSSKHQSPMGLAYG